MERPDNSRTFSVSGVYTQQALSTSAIILQHMICSANAVILSARAATASRLDAVGTIERFWHERRCIIIERRHQQREQEHRAAVREAAARLAATISLQRSARGMLVRHALRATVTAATVVQAHARGWSERRYIAYRCTSAVKIQAVMRGVIASARTVAMRTTRGAERVQR